MKVNFSNISKSSLEKTLFLYLVLNDNPLLSGELSLLEFCYYLVVLDEKLLIDETIELESLIHYKNIQQFIKVTKGHRKSFLTKLVNSDHLEMRVNRKLFFFKKVDYLIQNIGEVKVENDIILEFVNAVKNNETINNQYSKYLYDYYRYNILDDTDYTDWMDTTFVD
ncbi:hypothetical protein DAY19_14310 [Halobacteriovorax vibrionivorans]|uniref:Uncharacterized protein n=1 Tax=Halobacteriovorax vibrionivorans TaxID=2152716 RepID=A0ABY0IET3_9BACT|nr:MULTISPECIES: hypothetical protein [Halobacteriovorax]RZF21147.1 hypothetical protein DAY19_14310 [Halobacteriovorax vibrionivorans]TGD46256.1 hypothetical protein EP118_12705 [Halobacteriovorax sp. Y22]